MPANIYRTSAFGPAIPPRLVSGGFALYANGTGTAQFDSFNVTLYPDPTQRLTNAGRAVNSVSDHNSNIPANTRIDVLTSVDGGATYQPIASAGDYIPTISTAAHYAAVRAVSGLQGFYRLNEQSNVVAYDSSNNANAATYHNDGNGNLIGVTLGQAGALQGLNETGDTAPLFDGSTGYVLAPTSLNPSGWTAFSISFWFRATSTNTMRICANSPTSASNAGFDCGVNSNLGGTYFLLGNGSTFASPGGSGALTLNTWYHYVATWDGTTVRLYHNGTQTGTAALSGSIASAAFPVTIGGINGAGQWAGDIQGVAIWNTALTANNVTSIYNAGVQATQATYSDTFTVDDHTSYTQTNGTGGAGATWTWDTANSRVIAVGGTRALLIYNTFVAGDLDMLIDLLQAQNAGMVWRYTNASNYYELVVKDSANGNTYTLNKMASGTLSQLATGAITFTTGTHHRTRVTMFGGVITAYFDSAQILTYTDGSPLAAGQWGLRNDTGTSYTGLLTLTPQAPNVSNLAIYTKHTLVSNDATATPQVLDAHVMASDKTFGLGTNVPNADFNQTFVSDNIDNLNTQSNYYYKVDFNKNVTFTARDSTNAPWVMQSGDVQIASHSVEYSGDLYRNRQTLRGVYQTSTYTEIKNGNGSTRTWNTANPITSIPTITLNGLPATVGVLNVDTGRQFYWQKGSTSITQDNSQAILSSAATYTIAYTGTSAIDFTVDNTGQFAGTLSQSQLAALDGSTGVIEAIEDVSQKNMDVAAATTYANQLLQRYGSIARTLKGTTLHAGLATGQDIPVFIPELNIFDSFFLVVEVKTSEKFLNGAPTLVYDFVVSEAAALSSWLKSFSKLMRSV